MSYRMKIEGNLLLDYNYSKKKGFQQNKNKNKHKTPIDLSLHSEYKI